MKDGKTVRNMQSVSLKTNKFEKLVILVGFTTEIYYDARTYESQISKNISMFLVTGLKSQTDFLSHDVNTQYTRT
jgi:hypothetical protein